MFSGLETQVLINAPDMDEAVGDVEVQILPDWHREDPDYIPAQQHRIGDDLSLCHLPLAPRWVSPFPAGSQPPRIRGWALGSLDK